jgi:hypothetical protein
LRELITDRDLVCHSTSGYLGAFQVCATKNHWNAFIVRDYHHHQADAIFVTGIPDIKANLPHA